MLITTQTTTIAASVSAGNRRRDVVGGVVAAFLLAVLFTLLCVQWSFARGRLSQDVTYDDSMYMFEAGKRLAVLYDKGLIAYTVTLWRDPPHAPFTDFGAEAAFGIFGLRDWVPYVFVNGPVIFLLLLAVAYFGRKISLRLRVAMMIFTLSIPLSVVGLHEYRPDFPGALFTALGILLVTEASLYRAGLAREKQWLIGGLFFGLALITKAVFFAHTLTMEALAIAGACAWAWWTSDAPATRRSILRQSVGIAAHVALPSLLLAGPYFIVNFKETFGYFYDFALGARSHVSELKGGLAGSAYFYTFGYAGKLMLGGSFYVGLVLYALCLSFIIRAEDRKELLAQGFLLLLATISLGSIIVNKRENHYFGMPADMLLLFVLLRAIAAAWPAWSVTRRRMRWGVALLVGLCAVNLALLKPAMLWPYSVPPLNYVVHRDHSINQQILDDIWREFGSRAAVPAAEAPVTFVTRGGFVTAHTFRWLALKAGRRLNFTDVWTDTNPEAFRKGLQAATFVVAPEDNAAGVYNQNAAWELRFEVERMMAAIPGLRLLRRYPDSPGGPAFRLFVNDDRMLEKFSGFGDFRALEGFMPWEGPYPQWKLGKVRWAVGPKTRFALFADTAGDATLRFSARADAPVRATLRQRDAAILTIDLPGGQSFRAFAVPVKAQAGENEFVLDYENPLATAADGFQRALLFRQLELRAKP